MCYTYDSLNRVTKRQIISLSCDCVVSEENYTYDAAGNITNAPDSCFQYDTNNRLTVFNGYDVTYDMDGNMLSDGYTEYKYDSANRLVKAGDHTYTYNAEDVRIRNLCSDADTTYTYNTNCKLSQLLTKTTNGITTKYVYGLGLIGEEKEGCFKTYHFDYRGSTVAITDECGNIIDTLKYDTYGNVTEHIGDSYVIFGYNGRDGVITDKNGLYYMRARYYSPELRRFVNADILRGEITDSTSLNRYAYVNGNPISLVDPFGLEGIDDRGGASNKFFRNQFGYRYKYDYPTNLPPQPIPNEPVIKSNTSIGQAQYLSQHQRMSVESVFGNKKYGDKFKMGQSGFSEPTATNGNAYQVFNSVKYEKSFFGSDKYHQISYVFLTAPKSEWEELVVYHDLYPDDVAENLGVIIRGGAPIIEDVIQSKLNVDSHVGDFVVDLYYDFIDAWKRDFDHTTLDPISSHIAKSIQGFDDDDLVSVLLGASYYSVPVEDGDPDLLFYARAWDDELSYY